MNDNESDVDLTFLMTTSSNLINVTILTVCENAKQKIVVHWD